MTTGEKVANYPCLCWGDNDKRNQNSVKCVMYQLWAHKNCVKLSDETFKALLAQLKESGSAYWVCRPCQNFANRNEHKFSEVQKRNEDTDRRVTKNTERIKKSEDNIEELRETIRRLEERAEKDRTEKDTKLYEEMQEREVRRLNLVLHGVQEPADSIRTNRERQEADKQKCGEIFISMRASTKCEDIKFCRRIGERGAAPRPLIIGLENKEVKRHLLWQARNLAGTRFHEISLVPDLTRKQREVEDNIKKEAEARNRSLTREDISGGLSWFVVGKRGEKRLVKGVERQRPGPSQGPQWTGNQGLRGGYQWWDNQNHRGEAYCGTGSNTTPADNQPEPQQPVQQYAAADCDQPEQCSAQLTATAYRKSIAKAWKPVYSTASRNRGSKLRTRTFARTGLCRTTARTSTGWGPPGSRNGPKECPSWITGTLQVRNRTARTQA